MASDLGLHGLHMSNKRTQGLYGLMNARVMRKTLQKNLGGIHTKLPISQLLIVIDRYPRYLICIFMKINEEIRGKKHRKLKGIY